MMHEINQQYRHDAASCVVLLPCELYYGLQGKGTQRDQRVKSALLLVQGGT